MAGGSGNQTGSGDTSTGLDISASIRKKLNIIMDDIREIRDQGKTAISDPSQQSLFKGMITSVNSLYEHYNTLYYELCDLSEDDGSDTAKGADHIQRNTVKRYVHESHSFIVIINDEATARISSGALAANTTLMCGTSRARAKLPTIPLIKFDGDRSKWTRFRDLFESLVIGDDQLQDIDKYHYLIASLEEPASAVIAKLPLTDANFQIAWKSIKDVYDNKRLLAGTYLDQLLDLKALTKKPASDALSSRVALLSETVAALKLVGIPGLSEFILFHLASRSLDPDTRIAFENHNSIEFPKFDNLLEFVRKRCTAAELASSSAGNLPQRPVSPKQYLGQQKALKKFTLVSHAHNTGNRKLNSRPDSSRDPKLPSACYVCGGPHVISSCLKFCNASSDIRHQLLSDWKGCRNCLSTGHATRLCSSKWRCKFCQNKHHSLLHFSGNKPSDTSTSSSISSSPASSSNPSNSNKTSLSTNLSSVDIMLGTALCRLGVDKPANPVRLVIDSGSHISFVTQECAQRIGLTIDPCDTDIWGIGETPLAGFKGQATCTLSPMKSSFPTLSASVIVVEKITSPLPGFETPPEYWQPYLDYDLADPTFWITEPIDFLLGCDLFGDILTGKIITIKPDMPKLLGTIFGYSVLGRVRDLSEAAHISTLHSQQHQESSSLDLQLQRFWQLEEPPPAKVNDPLDDQCEQLFCETTYRLDSGRYVVRLPFRSPNPQFPGSKVIAQRRLTHLESKLERSTLLKSKYHEFMKEYLDLGHMELSNSPGKMFIPHHCVVKGEGSDMKIRVVFDAAARTSTGSLNDFLLAGPKLQADLVTILLNFRQHKFVFTADAVKMFRQILVHPHDRQYQHILWRFNLEDQVQDYELKTVSYGQSCAPYLANRAVRQLVIDEGAAFPLAATALSEDTYVDDVVTGANTIEEATEMVQQIIALMAKGGFSLSKWAANHPALLDASRHHDPDSTSSNKPVSLETTDDTSSIKILGLQWDPQTDEFLYRIIPPPVVNTKRGVLSAMAKIYDPLGFLGPTVVLAKIIIQEAWKRKLGWDDVFPPDLHDQWKTFLDELHLLSKVRIPRHVLNDDPTSFHLLIFADASEKAYCASAFLHIVSLSGVKINLILAKTKLAPVKAVTIPRLELCAALLAARIRQALIPFCQRLPMQPITKFFSDSTVVLAWLQTPTYRLKTFVANRVEKILELSSNSTWHHVASEDNPSDLGSRGVTPTNLLGHDLWFHGPIWSRHGPASWPLQSKSLPHEIPDTKVVTAGLSLTSSTKSVPPLIKMIERFSSFSRMVNSVAYLLRFINRLKGEPFCKSGSPNLSEIRNATLTLIKAVQAYFLFDCSVIDSKTTPPPKNLASLHPFFSEAGVLLVGGRLEHSQAEWSCKHPIILPAKSHFTFLLLTHYHKVLLHPGPTVLLAVLRTKYWVLGARNSVRLLTRSCVSCRKLRAPPCQPLMGDLPSCRFREGRAFLHVGTDFAGPFSVRESLRRKAPHYKCYLCVFVCLSTKAVHLETVTSLSTDAFIAALERFIGRRGLPEKIFSDHGTNYVGASNLLKDLHRWYREPSTQENLTTHCAQKEIEWSFSPPTGASFGGIWESVVKAAKRLLGTIYGENKFTFEELTTWLVKIEAILNSRPLCPLSSDPNDLAFLSPGHFLIGSPLLAYPEKSLIECPDNRLSRWQLVCQKSQHFWNRWRTEYLTTLQERTKWQRPDTNLLVGDLVIVRVDNAPRMHWPMARVCDVHPGKDGVVRVVTVKTVDSVLKRPANKLVPLFLPSPKEHSSGSNLSGVKP